MGFFAGGIENEGAGPAIRFCEERPFLRRGRPPTVLCKLWSSAFPWLAPELGDQALKHQCASHGNIVAGPGWQDRLDIREEGRCLELGAQVRLELSAGDGEAVLFQVAAKTRDYLLRVRGHARP